MVTNVRFIWKNQTDVVKKTNTNILFHNLETKSYICF